MENPISCAIQARAGDKLGKCHQSRREPSGYNRDYSRQWAALLITSTSNWQSSILPVSACIPEPVSASACIPVPVSACLPEPVPVSAMPIQHVYQSQYQCKEKY